MLGLSFKRDSDDVRDSLSYKLVRLLERELAHVARHDPHVPGESEALDGGAGRRRRGGHRHQSLELRGRCSSGCPKGMLLVDPWNVTGSGTRLRRVRQRAAVEPA